MYCRYCGRILPENGVCSCRPQTQPPPVNSVFPGDAPPPRERLLEVIRRESGSKLHLALCILQSLLCIAPVALIIAFSFLPNEGFSGELVLFDIIAAALLTIPGGLLAAGCWLNWANAKRGQRKPTGHTLISCALIFRMVYMGVCGVVFLIGFGMLFALSLDHETAEAFQPFFPDGTFPIVSIFVILIIMVIVFLGGLLTLFFLYCIKLRQTVTTTRAVLCGQENEIKVPLFPIVMQWIGVGSNVLNALNCLSFFAMSRTILQEIPFDTGGAVNMSMTTDMAELTEVVNIFTAFLGIMLAYTLLSCATLAVSAVLLSRYRKEVAACAPVFFYPPRPSQNWNIPPQSIPSRPGQTPPAPSGQDGLGTQPVQAPPPQGPQPPIEDFYYNDYDPPI